MSESSAQAAAASETFELQVRGGGERQASPSLDGIRADHVSRYTFASQLVRKGDAVLDAACGVGYGSYLLATRSPCESVVGVDLSDDALTYANQHYAHPKVSYRKDDCTKIQAPDASFDFVVSFETIEHIENPAAFLLLARRLLKPDGKLILSTPNEEQLPFSPEAFPFHVRHYLPSELMTLIGSCGFAIERVMSNVHRKKAELLKGWDGPYNIALCRPDRTKKDA